MNIFSSRFAPAFAVLFIPAAVCAQGTLVLDPLPDQNGTTDHIDYKSYVNPARGFVVLPDGGPGISITDHLDGYKPSVNPLPVATPVGPASFLSKVTGASGRSYGALKLNVSAGGAFTAVLRLGNRAYRFHGTLDGSGSASQVLTPRSPLPVAITVQVSNGHLSAAMTKGSLSFSVL